MTSPGKFSSDETFMSTCTCNRLATPWAKTIKKNTNSTQNKSQTHRAKQYEATSFLSTDCELSTETCSKNVYSLGPLSSYIGDTDLLLLSLVKSSMLLMAHFNSCTNYIIQYTTSELQQICRGLLGGRSII